jgi:protein-S-isoprenylcysteine O-methyltransferase Ste14
MENRLTLAYGLLSYAIFVIAVLWAIAFLGNLWIPLTVDSAPRSGPLLAVVVDLALLGLFAAQHSVMARKGFKRWWTAIVPERIERSTYVLATSLILILLFAVWQPIAGTIWSVQGGLHTALRAIYAFGWLVAIAATFQISHLDFLGLRQVWAPLTSAVYETVGLRTPFMYRIVRHPMMLGLIIVFWSSPIMTVGHVLFSAAATAYIVFGTRLEERDLLDTFGEEYAVYRERTPMLIPFIGGRK